MNPKLQELCDRAEILDCMHRYARGMDRLTASCSDLPTTTVRSTTTSDSSVPSTISSTGRSNTTGRRRAISIT